MADVLSPLPHAQLSSESTAPFVPSTAPRMIPPAPVSLPQSGLAWRSGHLNLDNFSPVNQNGSFAFDQVLKNGEVLKRTRKTKQWKPFHLVLRPNLLSLYKSATEERLLKQITLSELTAVAYVKDPKGRRESLFGLYSPSRNWHLQARSDAEAQAWVKMIRREARIDEEEQELFLGSPFVATGHEALSGPEQAGRDGWEHERFGSSSPEPVETTPYGYPTAIRDGIRIPGIRRCSVPSIDYSGDDFGYTSDFSDTPSQSRAQPSSLGGFITRKQRQNPRQQTPYAGPQHKPDTGRNASQISGVPNLQDEEKVIWNGYLLCLNTHRGVKRWKRLWVVLRPKNLTFYKNDEEYAATLLLPLSTIIDAVEIDPLSRSKSHCMQIIAENKSHRFCASSENALAEWLGALKSQLARRKDKGKGNLVA